jgi:hypothetical protein
VNSPEKAIQRYLDLRSAGRRLNSALIDRFPRGAEVCCGRMLGLLEDEQLAVETDTEITVLLDFCMYHHRENGRRVMDRYREEPSGSTDADEALLLQAMEHAYYSLLRIEEVVEGLGARCADLLRGENLLLVDRNLSYSAGEGMLFGCHVMKPDGIAMSTGGTLPVTVEALEGVQDWIHAFHRQYGDVDYSALPYEQETELAAGIIRAALRGGGGESISFKYAPKPEPEGE